MLLLAFALLTQFTDPELPPLSLTAEVKPVALGRLAKFTIQPFDRSKYPTLKSVNYEWIVTELSKTQEDPIGSDLDIDRLDESIARFGSGVKATYVKITIIGIYSYPDKIKRNRKEFEVQIGSPDPPTPIPDPKPPKPDPTPDPPKPPPAPTPQTLRGLSAQLYKSNAGILTKEDALKFAKTCEAVVTIAQNQSWGAKETVDTWYGNLQESLGANYNSWNQLYLTPLYAYLNKNPAKTPIQLHKQLIDISQGLKD